MLTYIELHIEENKFFYNNANLFLCLMDAREPSDSPELLKWYFFFTLPLGKHKGSRSISCESYQKQFQLMGNFIIMASIS